MGAPAADDIVAAPVDEARVRLLTDAIFAGIARPYQEAPTSRDRVYELLNALAVVSAAIIRETGDAETRTFFEAALKLQLALN